MSRNPSLALLPWLVGALACGVVTTPPLRDDPSGATGLLDPDAQASSVRDSGLGAEDPVDDNYPAPHSPLPVLDNNGGSVLTSPRVVTVTYDGDPKAGLLETFGDTITSSRWWDTVRDGFCDLNGNCVGRGAGGGHVHLGTPPLLKYADSTETSAPSTIKDFVARHIEDGTFPPPDPNTVYAIYFPSSVSVTLDGAISCSQFSAFHNSTVVAARGDSDADAATSSMKVAYVIVPRCSSSDAALTVAASHELAEAATDPYVSARAYYMTAPVWTRFGGENADLCVSLGADDAYAEGPFFVQRAWSFKAAAASHDPCVPAPDPTVQPYFNVAPDTGQDTIVLSAGTSETIALTAFSDGPMADWEVSAAQVPRSQGGSSVVALDLKLDRQTAHNGSKLTLTVTQTGQTATGYALFVVSSRSGATQHSWPLAVVAN